MHLCFVLEDLQKTHNFSVESSHNVSAKGEKGLFDIYTGFCTCFQKLNPVINSKLGEKKGKNYNSY